MKTSMHMAYNWRLNRSLLLAALLLSTLLPSSALGQEGINEDREKRAQTGFKFLSVSVHPRAAALGNAMTAIEGDAWTLFYNPAGMAAQTARISTSFGITQWIAGIDYNAAAISFRPFNGRYGVVGVTVRSVDYGSIQGTIRADNDQGFLDTGTIEPTALSVGLGYARALTDRFSIGARIKFATQDLGSTALSGTVTDGVFTAGELSDDKLDVLAFDFGMLYKTGFRSLTFAVAATNFSQEIEYVDESFQLPLTLKIGVAMDVADLMTSDSPHSLMVALEASHPRDFSEQINVGLEYGFFESLFLRAGYSAPIDEQGLSLGAGLAQGLGGLKVSADYAYTDFGVFSAVHRVAVQLSF